MLCYAGIWSSESESSVLSEILNNPGCVKLKFQRTPACFTYINRHIFHI